MRIREFLIDSSSTGRFIIKSQRTGRTYFVEAVGEPRVEWGSLDQASGKLTTKKGWKKYKGSIEADESMITKENGFNKIHQLRRWLSVTYTLPPPTKYPTI